MNFFLDRKWPVLIFCPLSRFEKRSHMYNTINIKDNNSYEEKFWFSIIYIVWCSYFPWIEFKLISGIININL